MTPEPRPGAVANASNDSGGSIAIGIGSAPMSGGTEVSCSLEQAPGTDDGRLQISATSECKTNKPLELLVQTALGTYNRSLDRGLEKRNSGDPETFPSFYFPLPPAGSLVRARVTAKCSGAGDDVAWGTGHCTVPRRPSERP